MKIDIKGTIIPSAYQWIYDLFGIEATSPAKVNSLIDSADGDDLEVIINSPGGDVYSGSEIYTMLKEHEAKANVVSKIVGVAASAASVIAMAGKTLISPTAQIMIHNAYSVAGGDHRDLQHGSDFLRGWDKSITNAYALKTGMSQKELLDLMDKETWLGAQDAKEKGFVDEIMFENQNQPRLTASIGNAQIIPQQVIDKIRNEFKKGDNITKDDLQKMLPQGSIVNQSNPKNEQGDDKMDLEKLKNEYPDLYNQIKQEGHDEGAKEENGRIKAIEDMAVPGHEELINKAKFETKETAEKLAMNIIKAQKEQGANYLQNRNIEAGELNNIQGTNAPENNKTEDKEREENANTIANFINKSRGGNA
ncbi:head maturation protease, ClpP-related [Lentibacillus sp. Marseille-P4043]|uniref:head maturation protease, ClpP-related n=1 Tax=Lentibacillus sp. Marseille-P4043 TaxID=2040293 RepID=UPI000D0AD5C8|nr:head maturation protease, ClpP-related [Lentibacillus sp. Marseille-P4043]